MPRAGITNVLRHYQAKGGGGHGIHCRADHELLVCIGLAAATTAIFVVAVITVVHGLRMAGRQR
jgi:hypothetical protein